MSNKERPFYIAHPYLPPVQMAATTRLVSLEKYLSSETYRVELRSGYRLEESSVQISEAKAPGFLGPIKRLYFKFLHTTSFLEDFLKNAVYLLKVWQGRKWLKRLYPQLENEIETAWRESQKPIIIYTSFSPLESTLMGLKLKKRFSEKVFWISDMRDEMSRNVYMPWIGRQHLCKYEREMLQSCDLLTVVSEGQRAHYSSFLSGFPQRSVVMMNGFDFEVPEILSTQKKRTLEIIFPGSFYKDVHADDLFEALDFLGIEERSRFHITLLGNIPEFLRKKYSRHAEFFTVDARWYPYEECIRRIQQSDIGLLIAPPVKREGVFPVKLADFIGARIPILAITGATLSAEVINELDAGYVAQYGQAQKVADTLRQILSDADKGQLKRVSFEDALRYSRKRRVEEFQMHLDRIIFGLSEAEK